MLFIEQGRSFDERKRIMTGAIPVFGLELVALIRARVNRADSGAPQWVDVFFADPELARTFYDTELPENRCGVLEKVACVRDPKTTYYSVPKSLMLARAG